MSTINPKVNDIVDELDPNKKKCVECHKYRQLEDFRDARHEYDECIQCYNTQYPIGGD